MKATLCLCGLMVVALAAGCGQKVYLAVEREVFLPDDIKALKAIAVLPIYTDNTTDARWSGALTDQLQACLLERLGRFQSAPILVDRSNIARIMEEQKISISDLADPATAAKVGRLVGADAIVNGKVSISVSERLAPSIRANLAPTVQRTVTAIATLSMVKVDTSAAMRTKFINKTQSYVDAPESTVNNAISKCVQEFSETVFPSSVTVHEFTMVSTDCPPVKEGLVFAKVGNWPAAVERFEAATKADPSNPVAFYDLGVSRLMLGEAELAAAQSCIDKAVSLKVDENYARGQQMVIDIVKMGPGVKLYPFAGPKPKSGVSTILGKLPFGN